MNSANEVGPEDALKDSGAFPRPRASDSGPKGRGMAAGNWMFIGVMISLPFLLGAGWSGCDRCDTSHCNLVPQEIRVNKILAVGDSFTAYYSRNVSGCCQSFTDYASIEIDEFIQNEAVGGARLSGGEAVSIPQQYANAKSRSGPYDVVLVEGGGNDLMKECPVTSQACSISCQDKQQEISDEMRSLIEGMVQDGSHVILVGGALISNSPFSVGNQWYNECWLSESSSQAYADSHPYVSFVSSRDLANPNNPSDYSIDGVHPSISLTQKIGKRVGHAIDEVLASRNGP